MKAVAWPMILSIVIGVIVLFVGWSLINPIFADARGFDPLGAKAKLRSIELGDDLEEAIKCAYYRCLAGCGSSQVNSISWSSETVKCSEFCKRGVGVSLKSQDTEMSGGIYIRPNCNFIIVGTPFTTSLILDERLLLRSDSICDSCTGKATQCTQQNEVAIPMGECKTKGNQEAYIYHNPPTNKHLFPEFNFYNVGVCSEKPTNAADEIPVQLTQDSKESDEAALHKAIQCTYYRCAGDSKNPNVKPCDYVQQKFPDGSCACGTYDENNDGKVCEEESSKHPFKFSIKERADATVKVCDDNNPVTYTEIEDSITKVIIQSDDLKMEGDYASQVDQKIIQQDGSEFVVQNRLSCAKTVAIKTDNTVRIWAVEGSKVPIIGVPITPEIIVKIGGSSYKGSSDLRDVSLLCVGRITS